MHGLLTPLLAGLLTGTAISLWPGNTLSVTIRESTRHGPFAGVEGAGGRAVADLLALTAIGLTVTRYPWLFAGDAAFPVIFGVLSGLALAAFGWHLMDFHAGGTLSRERGEETGRAWHENPFLDRLLGSLGNPLWHLFWSTAGLRLTAEAAEAGGAVGVVAFGAGYVLAGVAWHSFVAFRLRVLRRERALKDRQYRILTSLGGLALVGIGLKVGVGALAVSPLPGALEWLVAAIF